MEIFSYTLYGILIFITLVFMFGVRKKLDLISPTIMGSLYFVILTLLFTFKDINYLHLIWAMPLVYLLILFGSRLYIYEPVIKIFNLICSLYAGILRIGISKEKIETAKKIRKQELKKELEFLVKKRIKVIK